MRILKVKKEEKIKVLDVKNNRKMAEWTKNLLEDLDARLNAELGENDQQQKSRE